ncbi:MAG: type I secretion system permease/ATPase [Gammaproteobacteria bacterium]|nr:type I secretion system permease/ATPase [Gammaproteobacteria bacterium]
MTTAAPPSNPLHALTEIARRYLLFVGVLSFFLNLTLLALPIYMLQVYDRVLTSRNLSTLLMLALAALFVLVVMASLEFVRARILVRIGHWFDHALRRWLVHLALVEGRDNQAVRDLDEVRTFLAGPGLLALFDAPWTPVFLLAIYLVHPLLGVLATLGAIALLGLAVVNEMMTRGFILESGRHAQAAQRFAELAARNAEVIVAMAMSTALVRRWEVERENAIALQTAGSDRAGSFSALAKFARMGLQMGVLTAGAWLAIKGEISAGAIIACSLIMARALAPIEVAIGAWRTVVTSRQAYRRLGAFLDEHPVPGPRMSLPQASGAIELSQVVVAVPGREEPLLKGVGFALAPGEVLGITGPSAAGKSTLARVMLGVVRPVKGQVRIDGFDISAWNRGELGRAFGYLPQDVELFDGRVDENIARFDEVDAEAVVEAAQLTGSYDLIATLPNGFNTRIGVGGERLSGGQRQRIALARAVYGKPALVVLDEPSSNLDVEGEQALIQAIAALKARGTTVVLVTHRPNVLLHATKVLVLQRGEITHFGAADEVLRQVTRPVAPVLGAAAGLRGAEGHG